LTEERREPQWRRGLRSRVATLPPRTVAHSGIVERVALSFRETEHRLKVI